jgi:hypothetical protein
LHKPKSYIRGDPRRNGRHARPGLHSLGPRSEVPPPLHLPTPEPREKDNGFLFVLQRCKILLRSDELCQLPGSMYSWKDEAIVPIRNVLRFLQERQRRATVHGRRGSWARYPCRGLDRLVRSSRCPRGVHSPSWENSSSGEQWQGAFVLTIHGAGFPTVPPRGARSFDGVRVPQE